MSLRCDSRVPAEASVCEREPGSRGHTTRGALVGILRFAILALGPRKSGLPDLRAFDCRSRASPRSVSRSARASALAELVRDTRARCDAALSCERSVERAADAVRSLPRLRGRVGVGACVHKCSSMLGTSLSVCPLPVPPAEVECFRLRPINTVADLGYTRGRLQAGEGTLEPLARDRWRSCGERWHGRASPAAPALLF